MSIAQSQRTFTTQATTSASDSESEMAANLRPKIDPLRRQVTDFLKNTSTYEDSLKDTLQAYFLRSSDRLHGFATDHGTDLYYRRSQYDDLNLEVHPSNFKAPYERPQLKLSSLGVGTYMGEADDYTDYLMYDAIKTAVLSGGLNHIDTAPNYRYKKSEKTVGRVLTTLDNKYGVTREQLFVTSKAGYIAEDAEAMISRNDEITRLVSKVKVPEDEISMEQAHSMNPLFLKDQLEGSL